MAGLRDQEAVERVPVVRRQVCDREAVIGGQPKDREAAPHHVIAEVTGNDELADRRLTPISANDTTLNVNSLARSIAFCARAATLLVPWSSQSTTWVSSRSLTANHREARRSRHQ